MFDVLFREPVRLPYCCVISNIAVFHSFANINSVKCYIKSTIKYMCTKLTCQSHVYTVVNMQWCIQGKNELNLYCSCVFAV